MRSVTAAQVVGRGVTASAAAAKWAMTAAFSAGRAAALSYAMVTRSLAAKQVAWRAVTAAGTAAQWLLNGAMLASPIGILVAGFAAVAAAGVYVAGRFSSVREDVDAATAGLRRVGTSLRTAFQTAVPYVTAAVDSISSTVAGVASTVTRALAPAGALVGRVATVIYAAVTSAVGGLVGFVQAAWPMILDTVTAVGQAVYGAVAAGWGAVYGFVAPILSSIGQVIATNWQGYLQTIVAVGSSIAGFVESVVSTVAAVVRGLWNAVAAVWAWGTELITGQTRTAAGTTASLFTGIGNVAKWLADTVGDAMTLAGWAVQNFRGIVELVGLSVAYNVVRTGNEVAHVFGTVIPGWLRWVADNWRDILTTVADFTATVFTNMGKNVSAFFKAVASYLKGDGFSFEWKGLTDGFTATLKELPKIAEREVGALEGALGGAVLAKRGELAGKLFDAFNTRDRRATNVAKGLTDGIKNGLDRFKAPALAAPKIEAPKPPAMPDFPAPKVAPVDTSEIDAAADHAKAKAGELKAIFSGSAESQRLAYLAKNEAAREQVAANAAKQAAARQPVAPAAQPSPVQQAVAKVGDWVRGLTTAAQPRTAAFAVWQRERKPDAPGAFQRWQQDRKPTGPDSVAQWRAAKPPEGPRTDAFAMWQGQQPNVFGRLVDRFADVLPGAVARLTVPPMAAPVVPTPTVAAATVTAPPPAPAGQPEAAPVAEPVPAQASKSMRDNAEQAPLLKKGTDLQAVANDLLRRMLDKLDRAAAGGADLGTADLLA